MCDPPGGATRLMRVGRTEGTSHKVGATSLAEDGGIGLLYTDTQVDQYDQYRPPCKFGTSIIYRNGDGNGDGISGVGKKL